MVLSTHIVAGGAVAVIFPSHPITAFFVGFSLHYVMDTIPHWDYEVDSIFKKKIDRPLITDMVHICADVLIGLLIVIIIWIPNNIEQLKVLALAIAGSLLPDLLQLLYKRFPLRPMKFIQKIHDFFHGEYRLRNRYFSGVILQTIIVICMILLTKYLIGL